MHTMTSVQAAWVAGIIEGEGCFAWVGDQRRKNGQLNGKRCHATVSMTDLDVLERLQEWTGFGKIHQRTPRPGQTKIQYVWTVAAQAEFLALAEQIEPYLLSRRAERLREVRALLLEWQAEVAERRRICANGHDKDVVGRSKTGYCKECSRQATQRSSAKKRPTTEAGV